jgi:hypothetical protein
VLTECVCPPDPTWRTRVVGVVVEKHVTLLGIGSITVHATSRAEFAPTALLIGDI